MPPHTVHFTILITALAFLCNAVQSTVEAENTTKKLPITTLTPSTPTTSTTYNPQPTGAEITGTQLIANSTRYSRLMKVLHDPKTLISQRYHAAMQRVITRADHLPASGHTQRRSSAATFPSSSHHRVHPPMMRRIQHGHTANAAALTRYAYEAPKSVSNYPLSKGPVPFNAAKVPFHRSPFAHTHQQQQQHLKLQQSHPNALIPHTSAIVQQNLQHFHQQQQKQQPQYQSNPTQQQHQQHYHEEYNFKASPPFNGKAIVRPLLEPHDPNYRQHLQQLQQYVGDSQPQLMIKQYPIPQQPLQKQQVLSHFQPPTLFQLQSSQTFNHSKGSSFQTIRPHEEPVLHPHVKHILPPPGGSGYEVYENNELDEQEAQSYVRPYAAYYPPTPRAEETSHVYQQSVQEPNPQSSAAIQEAEEYINFMNSNDYFLPNREPNYKQRDTQNDMQQNQQRDQQKQSQTQQASPYYQRTQLSPSDKASTSGNTIIDDASGNYLNSPIKVSQLFYQEDTVPAIVSTSYQTGNNNNFVENSDINKVMKHIAYSPVTRSTTPSTATPPYSQVRNNTPRNRTPEPLRFEFTERDAIPSAYTHPPPSPSMGGLNDQLRYKAAGVVATSSTPNLHSTSRNNLGTSTLPSTDDPEDEEDVHSSSSNFYGRMPVRQSTESDASTIPTSPPPVEQKDTEEYCERMCANVQDSDEEIVCGSDGYMYTSEAQMECYASCLHIDVSVQSKGSCNAR